MAGTGAGRYSRPITTYAEWTISVNNTRNNRQPYITSLRNRPAGESGPADLHRFIASPAGVLVHYMNNQLQAIVPPQAFDDYVRTWPEARGTVAELRRCRAEVEALAEAVIARAMASSRGVGRR